MNIGIIGSGGREHSICYKLKNQKNYKIFCIPGNAGTAEISENLNVNYNNFKELYKIILKKNIKSINSWTRRTIGKWNC